MWCPQNSLKKQPQILRLTTPNLHPTNEDLSLHPSEQRSLAGDPDVGTPERQKSTPGTPVRTDGMKRGVPSS